MQKYKNIAFSYVPKEQPSPFACANAVVRIPQGGIITFPETIRK